MSDIHRRSNLGLLILASVGAGALSGALLGLLLARRPQAHPKDEITETVDDLKRRAEKILDELSPRASSAAEFS